MFYISNINYKEQILRLLSEVKREGVPQLIEFLESSDYFTAPASKNGHCNWTGGLCEHSWKVIKCLKKKNDQFKLGIPHESIIITGICHDLCKVGVYTKVIKNAKDGKKINGYRKEVDNWIEKEVIDKTSLRHAGKSIIMLQKFIELTEWELYAIMWHMGIPESYEEKKEFNKALEIMPSCLALHLSDFESAVFLEKTIK